MSLRSKALFAVTQLFCDAARRLLDEQLEIPDASDCALDLEGYYSSLPSDIKEDVISLTLLRIDEYRVKYLAIKLLIDDNIRSLCTNCLPSVLYEDLVETLCTKGTGIQSLNLSGVWLTGEYQNLLIKLLKQLHRLKALVIPHMATDFVLCTLLEYNAEIVSLNITENSLTLSLIELITSIQTRNIKIMKIENTIENVDPDLICFFLEEIPAIESFGSYPYMGAALSVWYSKCSSRDGKTNLKHVRDTNTTLASMKTIEKTCPLLQSLFLSEPDLNSLTNICIKNLKFLKLTRIDCTKLHLLIGNLDSSLTQLTVIKGKGPLDLIIITCLALVYAKFSCCHIDYLKSSTLLASSKIVLVSELEIKHFVGRSVLKYIFLHAPNLTRISIFHSDITTEDIREVFIKNTRSSVEDIELFLAENLDKDALFVLIDGCTSIKSIGSISGFSLNEDEILEVIEYVGQKHLNIDIW